METKDQRRYRLNKVKRRKAALDYYYAHRDRLMQAQKVRSWDYRLRAMKMVGDLKCITCGITDFRVLQINHKNGGGNQEFGSLKDKNGKRYGQTSPLAFYMSIIRGERSVSDLDIRCANCNLLYEYERGKRAVPEGLSP